MVFTLERNSFPSHCYGRELICLGGKDSIDKYSETIIGDVVYPVYRFTDIRSIIEADDNISYYSLFHPYVVIDKKIEVSPTILFDEDDDNFCYVGFCKVYFHYKEGKTTMPLGTYSKDLDYAIKQNLYTINKAKELYFVSQNLKEKLKGFKRYLENFKEK